MVLSPLSLAPQKHKSPTVRGISHGELVFHTLVLGLGNQRGTRSANATQGPEEARALRKSQGGSLHSVIYNGAGLTVSPGT